MSRYVCNNCERDFDEPATYTGCVAVVGSVPVYKTFYLCPYCESDNCEEVDE